MRRHLPMLAVVLLACSVIARAQAAAPRAPAAAPAKPVTTLQLTAVTVPPEALYHMGETAKFVITLKDAGKPLADAEVTWTLDKDGIPLAPPVQGKAKLGSDGTATVEGTLNEPGFLRLRASYATKGKPVVSAMAGAGFDPTQIKPSLPVPDDFDAFWAKKKQELAAVPMKPELTSVKSPAEGVECFDVQIPCGGGAPVSGYFARPAGAKPKSLPAILSVHGAGVRSSILGAAAGPAKAHNALAMDINAHGIPNGKPDAFYKDLDSTALKGYRTRGNDDREKVYFVGMFLRLQRAMDFLTSQPEWDGRILIVRGSSQGGGQSIAAAGLDQRVTLISAGVPAICDHSGKVAGRINGWPKLVPDGADGKPDPKALEVARYVDCMNFAARANPKCQAIFSVGFIDTVCPASSVYAAYNNFPGKKSIVTEPLMGHAASKKLGEETEKLIAEHIRGSRQ